MPLFSSCGFFLHALEHVLRLLAAEHEDHAFDRIVIFLEAELSKARRVSDGHFADVANAHGNAVVVTDDDVSDVLGLGHQAQSAHIEKLRALRIKSAARVRVICRQSGNHLGHGDVIVVDLRGIEQHLILHHRAAEPGIVRHSGHRLIGPLDDPVFNRFQLLRAAIRAFQHVAIYEP